MKRRIVCFESDDWGSYRLPLRLNFDVVKKQGIVLDEPGSEFFNRFDALENQVEITSLIDLLSGFSKYENPPKFTMLHLTRNPDFGRMKLENYQNYYSESILNSYQKIHGENVLNHTQKGINEGYLSTEYHGREHLNIPFWMRYLRNKDVQTQFAADNGFWSYINQNEWDIYYQSAFHLAFDEDLPQYQDIFYSGLLDFEELFLRKAVYFVPPNGPINNRIFNRAADLGIKLIAGSRIQQMPIGHGKNKFKFHIPGIKNRSGLRYVKRNGSFEPANRKIDWVDYTMAQINKAFEMHQPAIISTHRVNYIGSKDEKNRDHGLKELNRLIMAIYRKWPTVEFVFSSQLLDFFENEPKSIKYYFNLLS